MSALIKDKETGFTKKIRITNAVASYAYLTSPRPATSLFKAGQYGVELIITDEETKTLVKQYTKELVTLALKNEWNNKMPASLKVPYHNGDETNEREAGAMILSTSSPKFQPKLYIRDPRTGRASALTEEQVDEFYSGMLIDVDVTFKAYSVGINTGVAAYVNAVCKVGEGTPFGVANSLEESFSLDVEDDEDTFDTPTATKPSVANISTTKVLDTNIDDLLDAAAPTTAKPKGNKATKPVKEEPAAELSIDDLLGI